MKYFNGLNMGEGIAGPSTIGASTTVIYTCMGIALVNIKTLIGRLYHYPASYMHNTNVTNTIRSMINDIKPTEIHLTPAANGGFQNSGSDKDDVQQMMNFLKGLVSYDVTLEEAANSALLIWKNDKPMFNQHPYKLGIREPNDASIKPETRKKMSTGKREMEANIWYYGGDGEEEGVLEQGLKTTKDSAKGCCVIM
jgi:hypothetical protein